MFGDIDLIKKAVFLLIVRLTPQEVAKYVYLYLSEHPEQAKKIYQFARVIEEVIESEFKERLE